MRFLKFAFFASAVFLYFSLFFHNVIEFDQDLGRHLLLGKIIWQTHHVPLINLFSYTFPNFPFFNMHWLSEVVFFLVSKFSITSLVYFKVLVLITAFTLTLITSLRYSRNLVATSAAFVLLAPVLLERTEIRPEIFSYLFTAIFLYILLCHSGEDSGRSVEDDSRISKKWHTSGFGCPSRVNATLARTLWTLPVIELLWVNMHIYFFLGPVLVGIFVFEKIWQNFKDSHKLIKAIIAAKYAVLLLSLICLATLFNPSGILGATYPLRVFQNYGYAIEENQTVFFLQNLISNPNIIFFEVGLVIFLASFLLMDYRKITLPHVLLATLILLPLQAIRSFPFFFLLEMPIIAFNFAHFNPGLKGFLLSHLRNLRYLSKMVIILIIGLTLVRSFRLISNEYYLSSDSHKRFGTEIAESAKGSVDFVLKNKLHGPIFNNFDIGGYLDFRLYPGERVFVDNRPGEFPKEFFQNVYIPMQQSAENFKIVDGIYKFNLIIFAHTDATPWGTNFLSEIIKNPDYSLVYLDPYACVFVKKAKYPVLAHKLEINPQSLSTNFQPNHDQPITDYSYLNSLSLARIYSIFSWNDLAVKSIQTAFAQNPDSPGVLSAMGAVYPANPFGPYPGQNTQNQFRQKKGLDIF